MGLKFCSDFFWVRDFLRTFFGVDKKRKVSRFYVKQYYCIMMQKLSGILLNYYYYYYYYYFFNWTFFGLRSGPLDFFWVRV